MVSFIKQSFENIKYVSYPHNADFDNLPIKYKYISFTKQPIYISIDNSVEKLRVNSIEKQLDKRIYKNNNRNADFNYLPFDSDKKLIAR